MATALAEVVLKQLASLAADQVGLLWGLSGEISKLESTVTSIRAVLMDAEEQSNHNNQVQLWLRQLTEVLYDSEDLLDDISTEALLRNQMDGNRVMNEVGLFFSCSNQVGYALKLAYEIKAIRSKLAYIDQDKNQFKFKTALPVVNMDWRQTHSIVPDVVVGREDDKQKIIDMLRRPSCNEKVEVIPICGMGGLGKTALAQLIFNDDQIKSLFDCKYWVCVSETFELKLVVKSILEAITLQKVEDVALNTLKNNLHALIKGKRLLLVLDDVWNDDKEKWDDFKNLFSSGATEGSRIVVTTRLQIVAEITVTEAVVPHELQGLSKHESWSLFKQVAFKGGEAPSPRIMEIGGEIVEKCKGVPLALRAMGGLLHFKEESEWEAVREKQVLSLVSSRRQDHDNLEAILKLSYDNLPCELKRCFVYCSLFPKDHKFNVKMLVRLWMVQGYCIDINKSSSTRPSHPEDIGIGFFNHLLWRSLFQEVERDAKGNIEFCKMHDLLHDLAIRMAGEDAVMLEASNLTDSFLSCGSVNLERIRHLSIDCNGWSRDALQLPTHLAKAKKLRSFLIINGGILYREGVGRTDIIFSNMIKLRALSLDNQLKIIPATIHKLRHLRYLDISSTHVQTLPEEITRLVNLQVLLLNRCEQLQQLPREIGKLSNLEYLELANCWCLSWMPAGFGKLTRLRQLSVFILEVEFGSGAARLGELMHLNNLSGEFNILGMGRVKDKSEAEAANLKEKLHLRSLYLRWNSSYFGWNDGASNTTSDDQRSVLEAFQPHVNLKEIKLVGYSGMSLPTSWLSSLVNLVRIEVFGCKKLQSLSSLDSLVCLQELKLRELESLEYVQSGTTTTVQSSPSTSSQFLPSLMDLCIKGCRNLVGWSTTKAELQLLPRVSKLSISDCPKLESIPRFLVQFEEVLFRNVSSELFSSFSESLSAPAPSVNPRFHSLVLREIKSLRLLPQVLLPHLTLLERLQIRRCHDLTTLSPTLQHLPSLLSLEICVCEALELEGYNHAGDDENNNFPPLHCTLPSLHSLRVKGVPKLASLPEWLQHSSGLQDLTIQECDNLKCLPSWLTKLTALKSLSLLECSLLSGRCSGTAAEDWPNIAHIPNISTDTTWIQEDGCYLVDEVKEEGDETEETDAEVVEEDESEAAAALSLHNQLSRMLGNCIGRVTCNLFQRCFLPD
ncbi:Putative disease resistance protein RGA4 [Linum perenne]